MPENADFKICPYCGNWVRGRAYRCRHCKRWIVKPVNVPITLDFGIAKIPIIGTGLVDSDYVCPKCGGQSPKGSNQCIRCKKFRYHSTPIEGPSTWVIFWDKVRNFPELLNENAPECKWCAEVFWFERPETCPSCNGKLVE